MKEEIREENEKFKKIAEELIEKEEELSYIKNSPVRIVYLVSDKEKKVDKKICHADCEKVPGKYKWKIKADFIITVYTQNCLYFTPEQFKILLFHELLHIGIEEKDGEYSYSTVPHDIEDFKVILDKFGTDWSSPQLSLDFEQKEA